MKSLKQTLFVRMNITDTENNTNRLIAFKGLLEDLLKKNDKQHLMSQTDELEDYLLDLPQCTFNVHSSDIVSSITPKAQPPVLL